MEREVDEVSFNHRRYHLATASVQPRLDVNPIASLLHQFTDGMDLGRLNSSKIFPVTVETSASSSESMVKTERISSSS